MRWTVQVTGVYVLCKLRILTCMGEGYYAVTWTHKQTRSIVHEGY